MSSGRKVTDKISKIEDNLNASMFSEESETLNNGSSSVEEPTLVEPDFDKPSPVLKKVQTEIDAAEKGLLDIDTRLQQSAEKLQEQLNQIQAQAEEEKSGIRIRMIELNGLKKYLNNELF